MPTATIYVLCNGLEADGRARIRYVGQTVLPLSDRLRRHWLTARAGASEHRAVWMRAMERQNFPVVIEAVEIVAAETADDAEQAHISRLKALGCDLTNRTDGGRGRRGWAVSDETKRRQSEAARRRKASPETRAKMSAAIRASAKHQEHLVRLHHANKRPCPLATRHKISVANRGEACAHALLTWDAVDQIRARYAAGERQAELVRAFKCSPPTIHNVVHGKTWVRPSLEGANGCTTADLSLLQ